MEDDENKTEGFSKVRRIVFDGEEYEMKESNSGLTCTYCDLQEKCNSEKGGNLSVICDKWPFRFFKKANHDDIQQ